MPDDAPTATATIAGHPFHTMLVPFPTVCFVGALLTDITYARTYDMQWANFSVWLITAGLVMGVLAVIAGVIDFATNRLVREQRPAWPHALGSALAMVLSLFNAFVHSRDAYTSVVPAGLILSALVVLVLIVSSWLGGSLVYRHRVGVAK